MRLLWFWITAALTMVVIAYAGHHPWLLLGGYACAVFAAVAATGLAEQREDYRWMRGDGN